MNTSFGIFILYACLRYAGEVKQKRKGFVHHERDLVTEVISLYRVQCNVAEFFQYPYLRIREARQLSLK